MRYLETRKARIEIIPMIDIMFFLLVFFIMITLKMIPASGLATNLPQSSTAQDLPHPRVVVELSADGSIKIKGKALSLADLTARLSAHDPDNTVVTIDGAKAVPLQHLVDVMDACRKAGVSRVGIAADQIPTP